jgi:hypothetical protein
MLDAFIIEKIQRERELHESGRESLRIEAPVEPEQDRVNRLPEEKRERGLAIIDFNI